MRALPFLLFVACAGGGAPPGTTEVANAAGTGGDLPSPVATFEAATIECVDFGYVPTATNVEVYATGLVTYDNAPDVGIVVFDHCRVSPPPSAPTTPPTQ